MTGQRLSDWQRRVLRQLRAIVQAFPQDVQPVGTHRLDESSLLRVRLRLRTVDIHRADGGLPLGDHEEVIITVEGTELAAPRAEVDHLRFLHHAHVLQGTRLCLYLDPSREWDPDAGFGAFIDRIFEWFGEAAAGRFDAQTALYHAVGGVLHATDGAPTVVVRRNFQGGRRVQNGWLTTRTAHRMDLSLDQPSPDAVADHVPVLALETDLPLGGGGTLQEFLRETDLPAAVLTALAASASRKPDGSPQQLVIAVPHPTGGPPHLLAAGLPAAGADHLRALISSRGTWDSMTDLKASRVGAAIPLEWWPVSDERPEVTTRRDFTRPTAAYTDKTIHIWGCGGLGSWIAEFVVRAGAKKVVLCDPGRITGGLLVRQNFVETDVGDSKVDALARRLRAISDTVEVLAHDTRVPGDSDITGVDLIVDATVSVAISRILEEVAGASMSRPVLAQIATDPLTGTLGIMTVSAPPLLVGPLTIDRMAGREILDAGSHEAFHSLWSTVAPSDQVIPTRGCSTPTFHGSAADLAAVAGSLGSILGAHLRTETAMSGTHLISLPHGEAGPLRTFVPVLDHTGGEAAQVQAIATGQRDPDAGVTR